MVYFNYNNILKTKLDRYLSFLAVMVSLMFLFSKNYIVVDIAHFLYGTVYLFTVTFISENIYLLGLNIVMLLTILYTRYHYKVCILNNKENKSFFTNLSDTIKKHIWLWNWNYFFPMLILVTFGRFIKLKEII